MPRLLDPASTFAVILGAQDWSRAGLENAPSFLRSAEYFHAYLIGRPSYGLGLEPDMVLDLFDDQSAADDQLERISTTIRARTRERRDAGRPIIDLLIYYVGHGTCDFGGHLHLLVRRSTQGIEEQTSIDAPALAQVLRIAAPQQRRFIILDCCFSEAALKDLGAMGPAADVVAATAGKDLGPHRGTVLLCSSPSRSISIGHPGAERTLFTGALLDVLNKGAASRKSEMLSFADLCDEVYDRMLRDPPDGLPPRPALHQPEQQEGDLTRLPAFPNILYLNLPTIASFDADKNALSEGEEVILKWSVKKADHVSISADGRLIPGPLPAETGQITDTPTMTTEYVLTASNASRNIASNPVKVEVRRKIVPGGLIGKPLNDAKAILDQVNLAAGKIVWKRETKPSGTVIETSPHEGEPVPKGRGVDLTVSGRRFPWWPAIGAIGSLLVTALVVWFLLPPIVAIVTRQSTAPGPPAIVSFYADKGDVAEGEPVTLKWSIRKADHISIFANAKPVPGQLSGARGEVTDTPKNTTKYVLTASNANGSTQSAPVIVKVEKLETAYSRGVADWDVWQAWFKAQTGDRCAGADYWAANRNVAGHAICSQAAGNYSSDKRARDLFEAGCRDGKERLEPIDRRRLDPQYRQGFSDEARRFPGSCGTPTIDSFNADKTTIAEGETVTLTWSVKKADHIDISANGRSIPGLLFADQGKVSDTPVSTTEYVLTASSASGSILSDPVIVEIQPNVKVPFGLIGKPPDYAAAVLRQANLAVGRIIWKIDIAPVDTVVDTAPPEGQAVSLGRQVDLTISGPPQAAVIHDCLCLKRTVDTLLMAMSRGDAVAAGRYHSAASNFNAHCPNLVVDTALALQVQAHLVCPLQ